MTTQYEIVGGDYGPKRVLFSTLAEAEEAVLWLIDVFADESPYSEWCLVNDEGVVEDGFPTFASAQAALAASDPDDELEIDEREFFDVPGTEWSIIAVTK